VEELSREGEVDRDDGRGGEKSFEDGRFSLSEVFSDRSIYLLVSGLMALVSLEDSVSNELDESILRAFPSSLVLVLLVIRLEETDVAEIGKLDLGDGNEVVHDLQRVSSLLDDLLDLLESEVDVRSDVELANPLPPSLCFLSDDEDASLGMEEGGPVVGIGDGDGVVEVGEDEFGESFGDEEEMGSGGDGGGRGGRDGESVKGEGVEEDSLESFDGEGRKMGRHDGRRRG